jgi:glucose/arabinose dehydrogenase
VRLVICFSKDEKYASIMRMNKDGSELEVFAHGVRNTVGFDWHPPTKSLWFTDNGRDWLGDDSPLDDSLMLIGPSPWGRPVDVQVMPDGALLVSDDYAGAIYRITYSST